jgi:hypothetical protein
MMRNAAQSNIGLIRPSSIHFIQYPRDVKCCDSFKIFKYIVAPLGVWCATFVFLGHQTENVDIYVLIYVCSLYLYKIFKNAEYACHTVILVKKLEFMAPLLSSLYVQIVSKFLYNIDVLHIFLDRKLYMLYKP